MADQIVTNEIPATATQWFCCYRLVETLVDAGWTVVESSKGSGDTPAASDRWSGDFVNLASYAWIILANNAGHQLLFRRGATSDTDGWISRSRSGGWTQGGTDTAPANLPADAEEVRGTFTAGTPGSFGSDGAWFGSQDAVDRLQIGCRDATGAGDASFWIIAKRAGMPYAQSMVKHGVLALEALAHPSGLGIVDPDPYAWLAPDNPTWVWTTDFGALQLLLLTDNSIGSQGRWRRWWNAGQPNEEFKIYGSGADGGMGNTAGTEYLRHPNWEDQGDKALFQATPKVLIRRVRLSKNEEVNYRDPLGGYTQNIFLTNPVDVPNLSTLLGGTYAKFGTWFTVWWDGDPQNPPLE